MIRHLDDTDAPAWHCTTCEVGWSSSRPAPTCWHCGTGGVPGDVRRFVWWPTAVRA